MSFPQPESTSSFSPTTPVQSWENEGKTGQVLAGPNGPIYVSFFPRTQEVPLHEVFRGPGYTEPRQSSPLINRLALGLTLLCWVVPPYTWLGALVAFPLALWAWYGSKHKNYWRPGTQFARAALALSSTTLVFALMYRLLLLL